MPETGGVKSDAEARLWENCRVSENAARTQRSVPGMIGAMLVLLLIIGLFVAARSFTRDNQEVPPTPVDYLAAAALAQDLGIAVLYPADLPTGWVVTSVTVPRTVEQAWELGLLTEEGRFIALRQGSGSQPALVRAELGVKAQIEGPVNLPEAEVTGWRLVQSPDESGLVAPRPGGAVLIYGTADQVALEVLAQTLTPMPLSAP